ncbi:MAG: hypothetical protein ACP5R4_12810, partial [Armatimonadota bacterium]
RGEVTDQPISLPPFPKRRRNSARFEVHAGATPKHIPPLFGKRIRVAAQEHRMLKRNSKSNARSSDLQLILVGLPKLLARSFDVQPVTVSLPKLLAEKTL